MTRILRHRPSPSMVVAMLALFVALGGTALAVRLPTHSVGPAQLRNSAVRTKKLADGAVTTPKIQKRNVTRSRIAKKAIDSSLVATDGLTGASILESSFAKVPDADKLDGSDSSAFEPNSTVQLLGSQVRMNVGDAEKTLGTFGPFTLIAACENNGAGLVRGRVRITTSENDSAYNSNDDEEADFDTTDNANPEVWAGEVGNTIVGGASTANDSAEEGHAQAPSGTSIDGRTAIYTNFAGFDCVYAGYVIRTA